MTQLLEENHMTTRARIQPADDPAPANEFPWEIVVEFQGDYCNPLDVCDTWLEQMFGEENHQWRDLVLSHRYFLYVFDKHRFATIYGFKQERPRRIFELWCSVNNYDCECRYDQKGAEAHAVHKL